MYIYILSKQTMDNSGKGNLPGTAWERELERNQTEIGTHPLLVDTRWWDRYSVQVIKRMETVPNIVKEYSKYDIGEFIGSTNLYHIQIGNRKEAESFAYQLLESANLYSVQVRSCTAESRLIISTEEGREVVGVQIGIPAGLAMTAWQKRESQKV